MGGLSQLYKFKKLKMNRAKTSHQNSCRCQSWYWKLCCRVGQCLSSPWLWPVCQVSLSGPWTVTAMRDSQGTSFRAQWRVRIFFLYRSNRNSIPHFFNLRKNENMLKISDFSLQSCWPSCYDFRKWICL